MAIYNFEEKRPKKNGTDYQKISGITIVSVSVLALFCLITHFVPFAKSFLLGSFGLFCYPFFITALTIGFALINHKKYIMPKKYVVLLSISIVCVLCILQLLLVDNTGLNFWEYVGKCYTQKTTAGGVVIGLLTGAGLYLLNKLGAYIIFIALAVIFIALTADYIHYMGKNENLKKAIKVAGENNSKPSQVTNNITVKQLESAIKQNANEENAVEEEKHKEKAKITLNAKIEDAESSEESARRKLGLLASSKQDQEDNSRYFATEIKKQQIATDPKSYILSGYSKSELEENTNNSLRQIQDNLLQLKSKANMSSYNVTNSSKLPVTSSFEEYKKSHIAPEQIMHDNTDVVIKSQGVQNQQSSQFTQKESTTEKTIQTDVQKPSISIIDNTDILGSSINFSSIPLSSNIKNENDDEIQVKPNDMVIEEKSVIKENLDILQKSKPQVVSTLDVEDFSNNILASLRKEQSYLTKEEDANTFADSTVQSMSNDFAGDNTENLTKQRRRSDFGGTHNTNKPSFIPEITSPNSEVLNYASPDKVFEGAEPLPEPIKPKVHVDYVKPPVELLTTESMDLSLVSRDVVMKREELEMALDTFGIPAKVIGVVIGPAVTRYELEMPAGISIKRLLAIQDDIAYNLSSNGDIRIEAPIPGRRAVGIVVPNEKIATVGLRDIIMSSEFMESKSSLAIALGKDISGMIKTFSLVKIPHLLIAGTTGSGKSVCINAIILSLIYKYSPDEVKLILVDPKRVEFSMYNHLPHLLMPNVITDNEKALNALSWCVDEMERRYIVFANARVKNLEEYNESEEVLEGKADKMPYIIFIIDELADLLMTAKKEAEEHICRILQKARAAGIHMILATQRPSVDVVTGKIKANLNARICFALMTSADSKTVLDQGGADKLLGKGDMLFMSSDTGVPKRIQGCFVTTKEIDDIVTFVKENNGGYEFDAKTEQAIINPPKNDVVTQIDGDRASSDGFDALMPQVLKSVIESGHASISMIQRKFLVGFPRAARIIDQMEQAGYISPSDGSKSRSVYITMDEYDALYGNDA